MSIYVDFDGTLAEHTKHIEGCGKPVPKMMNRVKKWLFNGKTVVIFSARAGNPEQVVLIKEWLKEHGLPDLKVTNIKGYDAVEFWDDRAYRVVMNTGEIDHCLEES